MLFILKHSARALAIVSIVSFVAGALMWEGPVLGRTALGDFQVEPASRPLGDLAPGAVVPVVFKATNRSSHPIRVFGLNEVCTSWGCVRAKNLPCVVPPHGSADVALAIFVTGGSAETGLAFEREFALYSDCPGKYAVPVRVSGKVVPPDAKK
jgi:hypothetical protein